MSTGSQGGVQIEISGGRHWKRPFEKNLFQQGYNKS